MSILIPWPVALAVFAAMLLIAGMLSALAGWYGLRRLARAFAPDSLGDDTLAMLCPSCDGEPYLPCDCEGDCGRRYCKWATVLADGQFTRELRELLNGDGRDD